MLRGAEELLAHVEQRLGIRVGESTPDGRIFLKQEEECLAAAPVADDDVDHVYHENLTNDAADRILDEVEIERESRMGAWDEQAEPGVPRAVKLERRGRSRPMPAIGGYES